MITYLLIVLAAMFNSVMDKTKDTIQYESSIFYKLGWNSKFWNDEAFKGNFLFGKYKFNAWHVSKSCMLICFDLAISNSIIQFCIIGFIWIAIFNVAYNHILKYNK